MIKKTVVVFFLQPGDVKQRAHESGKEENEELGTGEPEFWIGSKLPRYFCRFYLIFSDEINDSTDVLVVGVFFSRFQGGFFVGVQGGQKRAPED